MCIPDQNTRTDKKINSGNRQLIQAFIQWARDMIRGGREPTLVPFPAQDVTRLIQNYKSHKMFTVKSNKPLQMLLNQPNLKRACVGMIGTQHSSTF